MKLIPEQLSALRARKEELRRELNGYREYLSHKEIVSGDRTSMAYIGDSLTDEQYQRDRTNYLETCDILEQSDCVTVRTFDSVQIGTKFIVELAGGLMADEVLMLTDSISGIPKGEGWVSCVSPLGSSVLGKKVGENFSYLLPGREKRKMTGVVQDIITDPKSYLHFIKDTPSKNRTATALRGVLSRLKTEFPEEYAKFQTVTHSQKQLLSLEKDRVERMPLSTSRTNRLNAINRALNAPTAIPPTDGTIGIGSTFDIVLTDGTTTQTHHMELINRAHSTELEDAYVERIDTLGSKLFGLKQSSTFTLHRDGKTYQCEVLNVDTPVNEHAPQLYK